MPLPLDSLGALSRPPRRSSGSSNEIRNTLFPLGEDRGSKRLNPYHHFLYPFWAGGALYEKRRYAEAVEELEKAKRLNPRFAGTRAVLAAALGQLGRTVEAAAEVEWILKRNPQYAISTRRRSRIVPPSWSKHRREGLRKAGLPEHPPLKLPDKPSIAVLPFTNMSDDKAQGYFSDGITEDIITDLSKISGLFVIARNSSFKYKGKSVDVRKVARDLGVRHVLEGSVRKAGQRVGARILRIEVDGLFI